MSSTRFTLHDLGVARSDRGATVSFRVTDSGGRAGIDVPQVYLTDPSAAGVHPAQLAFQPMARSPHRSGTVSLVVPATSFRAFLHGAWTTSPVATGCRWARRRRIWWRRSRGPPPDPPAQTGFPPGHQALAGTPAHGSGMVGRPRGSGCMTTAVCWG
jgi:hypothetical protein